MRHKFIAKRLENDLAKLTFSQIGLRIIFRAHTLPHRYFIAAHVRHTMDVAPARQGGKTEGWVAQEVVRLVRTAASNGKIPQAQAEAIVGATVP